MESTRYYEIQQYTGRRHGWEDVGAEPDLESAERCLRLYRENQPEYPVRKRVKVENKRIYWGSGANKHYENMDANGYKIKSYWLTDKHKDDMKHPNDY